MSDFLDKLAMEVAEWAETPSDRKTWYWVYRNAHSDFIAYLDPDNVITKDQWLQRRKELINEPDDADAPEWAGWKAQDADGEWYWFYIEPDCNSAEWVTPFLLGRRYTRASEGETPAGHDWRKTSKEVKRETKVEAEEATDPIESEIIRTIALIRVETDEYVRFSLVDHLDALLETVRNKVSAIEICAEGEFVKPDSKGTQYLESLERMDVHHKNSTLTQRKIQSVIDRGEYRKMRAATVLVSESGHAAIVSKGGAFYWVDNEALPFEYRLAGEGDEIN